MDWEQVLAWETESESEMASVLESASGLELGPEWALDWDSEPVLALETGLASESETASVLESASDLELGPELELGWDSELALALETELVSESATASVLESASDLGLALESELGLASASVSGNRKRWSEQNQMSR